MYLLQQNTSFLALFGGASSSRRTGNVYYPKDGRSGIFEFLPSFITVWYVVLWCHISLGYYVNNIFSHLDFPFFLSPIRIQGGQIFLHPNQFWKRRFFRAPVGPWMEARVK
jgi:hypothetical protein